MNSQCAIMSTRGIYHSRKSDLLVIESLLIVPIKTIAMYRVPLLTLMTSGMILMAFGYILLTKITLISGPMSITFSYVLLTKITLI